MSGFSITNKKGFKVTFDNGWTVSVQFGPGNYCDNYDMPFGREEESGKDGCKNAECALISPTGNFLKVDGWGDCVSNCSTPSDVLELLNKAANMPSKPTTGDTDHE